ncbi:hypothetical protein GCM10029978_110270 [Actinoallomurus acanthiterrae]
MTQPRGAPVRAAGTLRGARHILVTPRTHGVQYQVVHINAEYTNQTSDHDPQVVRLKP